MSLRWRWVREGEVDNYKRIETGLPPQGGIVKFSFDLNIGRKYIRVLSSTRARAWRGKVVDGAFQDPGGAGQHRRMGSCQRQCSRPTPVFGAIIFLPCCCTLSALLHLVFFLPPNACGSTNMSFAFCLGAAVCALFKERQSGESV